MLARTDDVVRTSEIEGVQLSVAFVRLSIARRLGSDIGALAPVESAGARKIEQDRSGWAEYRLSAYGGVAGSGCDDECLAGGIAGVSRVAEHVGRQLVFLQ